LFGKGCKECVVLLGLFVCDVVCFYFVCVCLIFV